MKKESNVLYILRLSLTLLLISALIAGALAGVNAITLPLIEAAKAAKVQAAITQVLPGGGEALESFTDETGMVSAVYASETGYAIQVAPTGFGGDIEMMVGIDKAGNILKVSIISQTETAGLGSIAAANNAKGEAFRAQFEGKSGSVAVTKDGGDIDAITSATITSRAVATGVNAALACAAGLG